MQRAIKKIEQAIFELEAEREEDEWISGSEVSQSILLSFKRENRFRKNKVFNGFVLIQYNENNNEFDNFLKILKQNALNIPPGTRIQLVVKTLFTDKKYDSDFYAKGYRNVEHWTPVDILVGENCQVSSFVLDAAKSVGYTGMHAKLKQTFPDGSHFVYEPDFIQDKHNPNKRKVRQIQTQDMGCRIFAIEHARQLSQIDSKTLYSEELPTLTSREKNYSPGTITAGNFVGGEQLARIFRSMQSWSSLESLPHAVQNTSIKPNETVLQSASRRSKGRQNLTILQKNKHYKIKKRKYLKQKSDNILLNIILQRDGVVFLENPELFRLNKLLAEAKLDNIKLFIDIFFQKLMRIENNVFIKNLKSRLLELLVYSSDIGKIKNEVLIYITSLFNNFKPNLNLTHSLNDILINSFRHLTEKPSSTINLDREFLKNTLLQYINDRQIEKTFHKSNYLSFWGRFTGMSADVKISAAKKIIDLVDNKKPVPPFTNLELIALRDGRLGEKIQRLKETCPRAFPNEYLLADEKYFKIINRSLNNLKYFR